MEGLYITPARTGSWEIYLDHSRVALDSVSYLLEMEFGYFVDHLSILILHRSEDQEHVDRYHSSFYTQRDGTDSDNQWYNRLNRENYLFLIAIAL